MKQTALSAVISLLVVACGLLAYDRLVVRPSRLIGVVDLAGVYAAKEAEFAALVASKSDDERQRAIQVASAFARRLPAALDELPRECRCLVVLKSAIAGPVVNAIDLTSALKAKLEPTS